MKKELKSRKRVETGSATKRHEEGAIFEPVSHAVVGAAIEVHSALGPGLLESAYEKCLAHELSPRGIPFERHKRVSLNYRGATLDCGFRLDQDRWYATRVPDR